MLKKIIFCLLALCVGFSAKAQEVFWGFDDTGKEMFVPTECDSTFDPDELYDLGMRFLNETGYIQQGAGYCMMASAFLGNVDAQYRIAWMYHRGIGLPKSDLAAYKWASLAALKGHQEADELAVSIEQFLSVEDMDKSTLFLNETIQMFNQMSERQAAEDDIKIQNTEDEINRLRREILDLTLYGEVRAVEEIVDPTEQPIVATPESTAKNTAVIHKSGHRKTRANKNEPIFSESDLKEVPMPSK